jgi:putative transposase
MALDLQQRTTEYGHRRHHPETEVGLGGLALLPINVINERGTAVLEGELFNGEMGAALQVVVVPDGIGLSASTVSRFKPVWAHQFRDWNEARLDKERWVYVRADGVYSGLGAEQTKLCALVVIGVNERGQKRFLAIEDGVRESTQSWREVLLKLKSRGMNVPELAIGDGAMGFWAALEDVYDGTRQQRCWMHKTMNVLNCLPKSSQAKAKQAPHAIWQAETKADAEKAFELFIKTYEPKYPKAAWCLHKDREELVAFYYFPAQHWQSIRTSNLIESSFATIRHRTKRAKGCLSRDVHAAHDVQTGTLRAGEMASITRMR